MTKTFSESIHLVEMMKKRWEKYASLEEALQFQWESGIGCDLNNSRYFPPSIYRQSLPFPGPLSHQPPLKLLSTLGACLLPTKVSLLFREQPSLSRVGLLLPLIPTTHNFSANYHQPPALPLPSKNATAKDVCSAFLKVHKIILAAELNSNTTLPCLLSSIRKLGHHSPRVPQQQCSEPLRVFPTTFSPNGPIQGTCLLS